MIKVENLVKNYKEHHVLKGINLNVSKGEIYGFIGHNGAGKSTTMNILGGLIKFQSGNCIVNGVDISKNRKSIVKNIGYLPEDPKFYPYMSGLEYLDFIGKIGGDSKNEIKNKSNSLLDLVKLNDSKRRKIGGYSRGMKQRLGMAAALYHNPNLLLLDEPTSALDPEGRKDIVDIINHLKSQGKTVFLSTHILSDVERVCDRIGILHGGKIIIEESLSDLMKKYIVPVYDIEFKNVINEKMFSKLNSKPYIKEVYKDKENLAVYIEDSDDSHLNLIKIISDFNNVVLSYNLRKSNLEDIFLRVVKEDE